MKPREIALSVVQGYGADVLTGTAPGISLADMIEVAVASAVESTEQRIWNDAGKEALDVVCDGCRTSKDGAKRGHVRCRTGLAIADHLFAVAKAVCDGR